MPVAPRPGRDLECSGGRLDVDAGSGVPGLEEAHRRSGVAELCATRHVAVAIGQEVQSGAGADFEQADGQPVLLGEPQERGV